MCTHSYARSVYSPLAFVHPTFDVCVAVGPWSPEALSCYPPHGCVRLHPAFSHH
ncbi:hypothetical protein C8T65DRAFT_642074 [Cerioporus squamosus]|nr:hypothetical protein C8T65DRAFT_642074 [Cerioporus squamosus]